MRRFFHRLWNVVRPGRRESELARELEAHLALLQEEYERRGSSRDEAARAARIALGGVEPTKEIHRDASSFIWLTDARQDLMHSIRLLRRSPLFTITAALSLSIGIGANTAIFSVASALLFRSPDGVAEPSSLIDIGLRRGDGGLNPMPYSTFLEIQRRATTLSGVFAQQMFPQSMGLVAPGAGAVEAVFGQHVTAGFFTVLGARPSAGRVFNAQDGDTRTANPVVVLNHGFWVRRFNRDANVVGQILRINGHPYTVVGVAAQGFHGTGVTSVDVWLPMGVEETSGSVLAGGRLQDRETAAQAAAELASIGSSLEPGRSVIRPPQVHAVRFSRAGGNRNIVIGFTGVLVVIVSLVLAVACANLAALLLARSTARSTEMALRTALGASRGRLARQLLTETVMLFAIGGTMAVALANGMLLLVPRLPALPFPISVPVALDARVIAFTALLSLVAALSTGIVPALKGSKVDQAAALKEGSSSPSAARMRSVFVVAQVALSLLLLVMAGLFVRALRYAGAADPGFDPKGVETASLDLAMAGYTDSRRLPFWQDLVQEVRHLPDVASATLARVPPGGFEGIGLGSIAAIATPDDRFEPSWNIVDAGYFETLRVPIVAGGRDFTNRDVPGTQPVAIVGRGIADRFWPGEHAVGQYLEMRTIAEKGRLDRRSVLIVGVVGDIKSSSLVDGLAGSYVYLPLQQNDSPLMTTRMTVVARSDRGQRLTTELAALVHKLDSSLAITGSDTLEESMALGLAPQRLVTTVAGILGLVGLLLAAIGVYGVTAYAVAHRTRELGIRMALGAQRGDILIMVIRHGLLLTAFGTAIGLALAAGASQVLSVFLYGLPPVHLPTFLGIASVFVSVGLAASFIPARWAITINPWGILRDE